MLSLRERGASFDFLFSQRLLVQMLHIHFRKSGAATPHSSTVEKKNGRVSVLSSPSVLDGERSDAELVQACLDGEEMAWRQLVTRYSRLVYSIPRRYGLAQSDADDVFQNVFTTVFRTLQSLRNQAALASWLITITHRETLRVGKSNGGFSALSDEQEGNAGLSIEQAQEWELQQLVHRAIDRLGEPCRDLVTSLYLDSDPSTYEALAARLKMPLGSIGPTRARCFKKLEALLIAMGFDQKLYKGNH